MDGNPLKTNSRTGWFVVVVTVLVLSLMVWLHNCLPPRSQKPAPPAPLPSRPHAAIHTNLQPCTREDGSIYFRFSVTVWWVTRPGRRRDRRRGSQSTLHIPPQSEYRQSADLRRTLPYIIPRLTSSAWTYRPGTGNLRDCDKGKGKNSRPERSEGRWLPKGVKPLASP